MPISRSRSSWLAILALLLLSSTTYAGVVGRHASKGVLNVTFSKPNQKAVRTVSASDEIWIFKANKTFSRGGVLRGKWNRKLGNVVEANYNRSAYATHLSNFWANLGVIVSNIRILKNKVLVQEVSNGLSIEETLVYSMDVAENGRSKRAMVSIRGSFVAPNGASENPALRKIFPTMWQGQAGASASSFTMTDYASSATFTFQASSVPLETIQVQPSDGFTTQPDPVSVQPDGTQPPQQ